MATDGRQFRPRVLVVPAGTTVQFQNLDPFNHNVFSLSEPNAFDLGLYGRGETRTRRFARTGLVRVYCNVHPRMSAFILVRDNPWYAQPGPDGAYTIPDVPPGRYLLHVWHERVAAESTREIDGPGRRPRRPRGHARRRRLPVGPAPEQVRQGVRVRRGA